MCSLIEGLEFIQYYLDDLLILSNGLHNDYLGKVEITLLYSSKVELKVRTIKYKFVMPELKYLGYLITREGIKHMPKNTKAILEIKVLKMVKQL